MRIPKRPTTLRTTLREHAERTDAPVFVYRFPTPEEEAAQMFATVEEIQGDPTVMAKLEGLTGPALASEVERLLVAGEVKTASRSQRLCSLFDRQLVTIENLEFPAAPGAAATEPFELSKHLRDIPGDWKVEVAVEIERRVRTYLSEFEEGNSSSPSSSAEGPTAMTLSTDVVAADA